MDATPTSDDLDAALAEMLALRERARLPGADAETVRAFMAAGALVEHLAAGLGPDGAARVARAVVAADATRDRPPGAP